MLKHVLRRLSPAGRGARLTTLIFHRVQPRTDPLFPDEIDSARFDAICRWLRDGFNVIPLDAAVERLRNGDLPERALSITFDDGYADNHDVALPILSTHGLTATFFIATGFIDGGRMWNDTVIESVRQCESPDLDLSTLGIEGLGVFGLADTAARRRAIDAILDRIKYLPIGERLAQAQQIALRTSAVPTPGLMLSSDKIRALRSAGMQIGAHTVSHPILARLPDAEASAEIIASKDRLEAILDERVSLFAYPNGRPETDFSERSVALVREAGFDAAVTTGAGAATASTDMFRLPRFTPWDRSRFRFEARLASNLWQSRR